MPNLWPASLPGQDLALSQYTWLNIKVLAVWHQQSQKPMTTRPKETSLRTYMNMKTLIFSDNSFHIRLLLLFLFTMTISGLMI